jgi:hypothetical protein
MQGVYCCLRSSFLFFSKDNQASARTSNQRGGSSSVCFGHMNFMLLNIFHTDEDTKNEGLHGSRLYSVGKFSLDYKGLQPGMAAQPIGPNKYINQKGH